MLFGKYQTYLPAISHILEVCNRQLLSENELDQVVTLYIFHFAHFSKDLNLAYFYADKYFGQSNDKHIVWEVLRCLAHDNYERWKTCLAKEQDYLVRIIMTNNQHNLLEQRISVISKCYFTLNQEGIVSFLGSDWLKYVPCAWEQKQDTITIRSRGKR